MAKFYLLLINVLLLFTLTGCTPIYTNGGFYIAGVLPEVPTPNYTIGPVSSPEFPVLLHNAIPSTEGKVHIFGQVEWWLPIRPFTPRFLRGVAAITDTSILLLKWYEPEARFEVLKRFPYSEIVSVSLKGFGLARYIHVQHKDLSFGDQHYGSAQETSFNFVRGIWLDREKTEAAFALLQNLRGQVRS